MRLSVFLNDYVCLICNAFVCCVCDVLCDVGCVVDVISVSVCVAV